MKSVEYRARCTAGYETPTRVDLHCDPASGGGFSLSGRVEVGSGKLSGSVSELRSGDGVVRDLEIASGKAAMVQGSLNGSFLLRRAGLDLSARCGDGNRIDKIRFEGPDAVLECTRDFERLAAAAETLDADLAAPVFRPASILRGLYAALGRTAPEPALSAPRRKPVVEFSSR